MKRLLIIIAILALAVGCRQGAKNDSGKKNVVTTIGMIADVAQNIAGDKMEVTALMGSGVDPHLYKASAGDVQRLSDADLILYNGLHLESKLAEILQKMGDRVPTVGVAEVVPKDRLLNVQEGSGEKDPHVWFDVELWTLAAGKIKDALIELDPANKDSYEANYVVYKKKLDALHEHVKSRVEELPKKKRILITAHDAFGYFGNAYGFEVKGLQGISTATEAGIKDVQNLAQYITDKQIPAIFIESSVPRRNVEALQAAVKSRGFSVKIGGELFSDAMGDAGSKEGTYIGMVEHNVNTIVDALKGE